MGRHPDDRHHFGPLRRRWLVIVVAVVVVVGVAGVSSLTQTPRYRAEAEIFIGPFHPVSSINLFVHPSPPGTTRELAREARQATSDSVVAAVREVVGSEPDLEVSADSDADVIRFTGSSRDPALAAVSADTYAESFLDERRSALIAQYQVSSEAVENRLAEVGRELDGLDPTEVHRAAVLESQRDYLAQVLAALSMSLDMGGAEIVSTAAVPEDPFEPAIWRNLVLALLAGVLLGVPAAFLFDRLDPRLRGTADLETATGGLAILAAVPASAAAAKPHVVIRDRPESPEAEAYRALSLTVQDLGYATALKKLAFTSPDSSGDGAVTAANLAVAGARAEKRVVLIDCNLRQPSVHSLFGLPNTTGFTTVLLGEASLETAAHRIPDEPGLVVITSGPVPPEPSELLSGKRARSLISSITEQADLVIIDSPPVFAGTGTVNPDSLVIADLVDGIIMVTSADKTHRDQVSRALGRLERTGAAVLGTVLNLRRSAYRPERSDHRSSA